MTARVETLTTNPIGERERITSIDVLRGFALLGILVMNIQSFAMISAAYFNPTAYGDLTGINFLVWAASHLLADQKFMTVFSMLFGAGIVVFATRAEAKQRRSAGLHYRRMMWLAIFGLLHAYLLWYGDILFTYAACGLLVYLLRRLKPGWLMLIGIVALTIPAGLNYLSGWMLTVWPQIADAQMEMWAPGAELVAGELETYRGTWLQQMANRIPFSIMIQTAALLFFTLWRVGGLMLIGMALFKMGVFSATRSRAFYVAMVAVGLLIGCPLIAYGMYRCFESAWSLAYARFFGSQYNYWASILVSGMWIGLVMLVCQSGILRRLTSALAAVGRMAFTNYLMQTVICTTIFYGHGLGLYGHLERWQQILIVLGVWALQLLLSPLWLQYFRFGPLEWLWRSLSYWRPQPLLRDRRPAASPLAPPEPSASVTASPQPADGGP